VDLHLIDLEVTTNYLTFIHLTKAFLPQLQRLQAPTSLVYITSGLALVPIPRVLNYCATKAALHHFILPLREELRLQFPHLKVVEILPPAVRTELHDEKHQPDLKPGEGAKMGISLEDFVEECWAGLEAGEEQVFVGEMTKKMAGGWESERQKGFRTTFDRVMENNKRTLKEGR